MTREWGPDAPECEQADAELETPVVATKAKMPFPPRMALAEDGTRWVIEDADWLPPSGPVGSDGVRAKYVRKQHGELSELFLPGSREPGPLVKVVAEPGGKGFYRRTGSMWTHPGMTRELRTWAQINVVELVNVTHGTSAERERMDAELETLEQALGNARVRFWTCPRQEHRWTGHVQWREGVAHCMEDGCSLTSVSPPECAVIASAAELRVSVGVFGAAPVAGLNVGAVAAFKPDELVVHYIRRVNTTEWIALDVELWGPRPGDDSGFRVSNHYVGDRQREWLPQWAKDQVEKLRPTGTVPAIVSE